MSTTPDLGSSVSHAELTHGRRWLILALVLVAQFMVALDATVVTVALPSMSTGLHFGSQLSLQWVINAYILLFGGFLLLGGRAGDLFGRQRLFVTGLALFTGASLVDGLAQSPGMLIAGRAVQGLGAALVSPAVLSIIIVTFESVAERTKALGYFSAISAGGSAAGMLAGGLLTEWLSWRAIFLVNLPIGVIGVIGGLRAIPNLRSHTGGIKTMDIPGAVAVTGGLTLLVYTIVNATSWGWTSARIIWLLVAAAALLVAFVVIEARSRTPLVNLGIFRIRSLSGASVTMFLMSGGFFTLLFFPTLYLGEIKGDSPIKIGLEYLPWPVAMVVAASVGQALIKRAGPKLPLVLGLSLTAVGLFTLSHLQSNSSYAAGILPGFLLTAVGAGLTFAAIFLVGSSGVRPEESGLASGLINTGQQLGSAVGLAAIGTVAASRTHQLLAHAGPHPSAGVANSALVDGFQRGFLIAAVIVAVATATALLALRQSDGRVRDVGQALPEAEDSPQPVV